MMTRAKMYRLTLAMLLALVLMPGALTTAALSRMQTGGINQPSGGQADNSNSANPLLSLADAENVEFVGHTGGATFSAAVQGNRAYIGVGPRLVVLDVSNPASPEVLGQTSVLPDLVWGVDVAGSYAYVANGYDGGLQVVDISMPSNPSRVGFYDTPGYAWGVFVSGDYAYVADGDLGGLQVVDISTPSNPSRVGFYDTPGYAWGVAVSGDYAYVADGDLGGLQVVDISTPSNPTKVGFYDTPGNARSVFVVGSYAYVADGWSGMRVVDVSTPSDPTEAGFYDPPWSWYAGSVTITGNYAYVTIGYWGGLRVMDISTPSSPTEVGFYDTPGTAEEVAVEGQHAYVADGEGGGLQVVNVSTPSSPTGVGFYSAPGIVTDVTVVENTVYVASGAGGLRVIDISTMSSPIEVDFCDTPGEADGVFVVGDYAYVADRLGGLRVIDISMPSGPTEIGFCDTLGDARSVVIANGYAYIAAGDAGLRVVDISVPSNPTEVGFCDTPGDATGVVVAGSYAYIADGDGGGLRVVDISTPSNPTEVGFYDTPGDARGVTAANGYAYIADGGAGLRVVDISTPSSPMEVGFYDMPPLAWNVVVAMDYAYIAGGGGLRVVDISTPSNPTEVGFYDTPGDGCGVAVARGYVYVADYWGGLLILRPTYSVNGHIHDSGDNPISGVTVSAGASGSAITDATGAYTITGLIAGTYVIQPQATNLSPAARVVRVPPSVGDQDFTTVPVYGTLAGRVTAQGPGNAIANARVSAGGKVGQTDANGNYTLPELLPGVHTVYVSADGYKDYRGEVTIRANTTTTNDVALEAISLAGYYLPYPGGTRYQCTQGNGGSLSHQGTWYYAFDFGVPDGRDVVATRGGRVVALQNDYSQTCRDNTSACINAANYVRVRHADGTDTLYWHLKYHSVTVRVGDTVRRGQIIAKADATGYCTGPHLDFTRHAWGQWNSVPISFTDVAGDGVPRTGQWYTSGNYPAATAMETLGIADTDPPQGDVRLRLTGQPTHTLRLSAFDYASDVTAMRLTATEVDLQAASWQSFTTSVEWTNPAAFAQYQDANGNVSSVVSDTIDAIGYEPVQAAFAMSPTVCVGGELPLTNQTTPFCEQCGWTWDFGNGVTSEEAEPQFDYVGMSSFLGYAMSGTYTVTLTVSNAISVSSAFRQVTALSAPSAEFTLIRSGATITVETASADAARWMWSFGDGITATGRVATHTYTDTASLGTYPVQLVVEGSNGCSDFGQRFVPIYDIYLPIVLRGYL